MRRTAAFLVLATPLFASAALEDVAGKRYSVDAGAGLQWLDLKATRGLSFDELKAGSAWANGWRPATGAQLDALLRSNLSGLTTSTNPFTSAGNKASSFWAGAQADADAQTRALIGLLGGSLTRGADLSAAGVFGYRQGAGQRVGSVGYDSDSGQGHAGLGDRANVSAGSADTGYFLVRQVSAVPEPSTYALMALGLGVVGFAARRRRSQR